MSSERCNFADFPDDNANFITEYDDSCLNDSSESLCSSGDSTSRHGDFKSMIAIYSNNDDKQVSKNERNWAELPSPAIENIYSFLCRTDQSRMSLVCSRWAKDFNSPCLWQTIKFYLPENDYSSEIYPEVKFARKYASMFRHVEIICKRVRVHLIDVIWRQLKLFLLAVASSSQLHSIKFINIGNYFHYLDDNIYDDLFKTIINFFSSQKNLKTVVFQDSHFSREESWKLLKAIFHSDNNTIKNLTLRGFVNEVPFTEKSSRYTPNLSEVCGRIANVQSLEVDYTQILEDLINCLYKKLSSGDYQIDKKKPNASTVNIYCDGKKQSKFRGISPRIWKYLANVFPNMKVKMDVNIYSNLNSEIEKFLVKEIPLQTLDFRVDKLSSSGSEISALFSHLQMCKYQNHLEVLSILWMSSIAVFDEFFIQFFRSCKKLQTFCIHAKYISSETECILKAFLENHPASLKSITLWFNYISEEEGEDHLRALSEEYYKLFNDKGIGCFLIIDPSIRLRRRESNVINPQI